MGEALTVPLAEAFRKRGDDEDNEENGDEEEVRVRCERRFYGSVCFFGRL